jgi:hypothetical protein
MAGTVGVAPGTTTLQLDDGSVIQLVDYIDDKHWGTCEWSTGDTSAISVFSAALSQAIPGGTRPLFRVDTNIPRSGDNGLPQSWEFYVYSIGVSLTRAMRPTSPATTITGLGEYSNRADDVTTFELNRKLFFEYKYNGKTFTQGVMEDYPAGSGAFFQGTSNSISVENNGVPSPRDRVAMVLPIWEREGLGYSMTITPEASITISQTAQDVSTALTFVDMRVKKTGLIKRQIN